MIESIDLCHYHNTHGTEQISAQVEQRCIVPWMEQTLGGAAQPKDNKKNSKLSPSKTRQQHDTNIALDSKTL